MVGYDNRPEQLSSVDFIVAGAVSGLLTRALCQPFDVLKIRFQLQVEPIRDLPSSKYHSIVHASRIIYKDEGVQGFWKGHIPAQYLSITYGLTQFYIFETLTKSIDIIKYNEHSKLFGNFICGAIAGGGATVISFPFDILRTRLIAQSNQTYRNTFRSCYKIISTEGVRGLYKGLLPTVIQVAPHAGIQFMSYKFFDRIYRSVNHKGNTTYLFVGSIIAGGLSGLVAKTAIYPFDLIKKRLQIQGFQENRRGFGKNFVCSTFYDCFLKILTEEGTKGLFKGLAPSLIKAAITTALHFNLYEFVCNVLELRIERILFEAKD